MLKTFVITCAFAVLASGMSGAAHAQSLPNHRTDITFSQPVSLPGVTLPAGTYQFRLVNPGSSHHMVQVLSADGRTPYALLPAIPAARSEAAMTVEARFLEAPRTVAWPVKVLWAPGAQTGWEFIYPPAQARAIAQAAHQPSMTAAYVGPMVSPTPAAEVVAQ
ncbi:MAG: hypothetical protein AB7I25_13245 [Vicinamibacterales bacterium]